jgi:hypothetical protein
VPSEVEQIKQIKDLLKRTKTDTCINLDKLSKKLADRIIKMLEDQIA